MLQNEREREGGKGQEGEREKEEIYSYLRGRKGKREKQGLRRGEERLCRSTMMRNEKSS